MMDAKVYQIIDGKKVPAGPEAAGGTLNTARALIDSSTFRLTNGASQNTISDARNAIGHALENTQNNMPKSAPLPSHASGRPNFASLRAQPQMNPAAASVPKIAQAAPMAHQPSRQAHHNLNI